MSGAWLRWIRTFNRKIFIASKVILINYISLQSLCKIVVNYFQAIALLSNFSFSASGCPIAAKNKGKSGYEGISSLSKYGPSSSTFGAFDQSTEHMMSVDDKDKNRMDTSDPLDEKV